MDKNTTESGKAYTHLSIQEREEIAIGLETGESRRSIARRPGRDPSAISREIRRNNNTPSAP
jgi:IS30 family transposase